jgi:putative membrane protein
MPLRDVLQPLASSRTLGRVFWYASLFGLYATIPVLLEFSLYHHWNELPSQFHAAMSLVLGWLLVFRTNTAYGRWWEARTLWGALVNACRNLALKLVRLGKLPTSELDRARELIVAFPVALRCHLRSESESQLPLSIRELVGDARHVPLAIASELYRLVATAKNSGQLDGDELRILDSELLRLMDVCGGCERILNTRIVTSYRIFARQCVAIFLGTLPWGFAHDFRIWTIPLTLISAYFMLGLETVAEHVEEPFGYDEDDLNLEALCDGIQVSVNQAFSSVSMRTSDQR